MKVTSVLLDATGIQQYVFGSNDLKENLGASYLVENIFEGILKSSLDKLQIKNVGMDEWYKIFKERSRAIAFMREWTKQLLIASPGLRTSVAIKDDFERDNYQNEIKLLHKKLKENKFMFQPQVILPRHGITAECSHTGFSAEQIYTEDNKHIPISSVAASKRIVKDKANEKLKEKFKDVIGDKYRFPELLDDLGQRKDESNYISVIHIDGNRIGERFNDCKNLIESRNLSHCVKNATESAMRELLKNITDKYEKYKENLNLEKNNLPIRPIIFGGDDVTFVADGRLGVYFTEIFIKKFIKQKVSDGKPLSACAGIAITKSKYPFYRGYELAEQLCREAKKKAGEEKGSSWLDFHIAQEGFSGTIQEIREKNYTVSEGNLCLRPYRVAGDKDNYRSLNSCIDGMKALKKTWPKSKLMELREMLTLGEISSKQFIQEMKFRGLELPDIKERSYFKDDVWSGRETPYFDMIELAKFYPDFLLDEAKT
ncbi:MAG: hypothetical protein OIN88_16315 [Candidatus Methanoperedens sp.]|nr:hypothetical protein [Candidatus Methanoperedens sp.]